jgi:hypothetical protein
MTDKKLQEVGNDLGVSKKDIANIRKRRLKGKLIRPIIGAIIVACSSGLGFWVGKATSDGGYPYAAPSLAFVAGPGRKKGAFTLGTVLFSVIGFALAYWAGHHTGHNDFHNGILYNVFSRQK